MRRTLAELESKLSRDCRERFEAAPEHYLAAEAKSPPAQPENEHA